MVSGVDKELMEMARDIGTVQGEVKTIHHRLDRMDTADKDIKEDIDDINKKLAKYGEQHKQFNMKLDLLAVNNGHYSRRRKAINYGGPTLLAGAVVTILTYVLPLLK